MARTQESAANERAGDQDESAAKLAKQATDPQSSGWLMHTQQNDNWLRMPSTMGDRVQSNLQFQPLVNVKLTDKWTLFTRPMLPTLAVDCAAFGT